MKLIELSAECRYGVIFPVGADAKGWKNSMKGTKTHFEKKSVALLHEFSKRRRACDVYFRLNTAQTHGSLCFEMAKQHPGGFILCFIPPF